MGIEVTAFGLPILHIDVIVKKKKKKEKIERKPQVKRDVKGYFQTSIE